MVTVVGETLEPAVFRAVYTETNARIQLAAQSLGGAVPLSADEASNSDRVNITQIAPRGDVCQISSLTVATNRVLEFAANVA
jgi:hypothetical protein